MAGGIIEEVPSPISMAGIISDQTDAATITPEANPSNSFCNSAGMSLFMKNTNAEPKAVPRNGIINAVNIEFIIIRQKKRAAASQRATLKCVLKPKPIAKMPEASVSLHKKLKSSKII